MNYNTPFVGLVTISATKTPPSDWLSCDGSLLSIADYEGLYDVIGTTYGGDGSLFFKLPDLRGRIPIGSGQGPGLQSIARGESQGNSQIQLTAQNIPSHNHDVDADLHFIEAEPNSKNPGSESAFSIAEFNVYHTDGASEGAKMHPDTIGGESLNSGGNSPYFAYQPFMALHYIISYKGIAPNFDD